MRFYRNRMGHFFLTLFETQKDIAFIFTHSFLKYIVKNHKLCTFNKKKTLNPFLYTHPTFNLLEIIDLPFQICKEKEDEKLY